MQIITTVPTTTRELQRHCFTPKQIQALETLKASYDPYREYCESNWEFERLAFLKWRYAQGEIREAITG
jgi:hypothetical protein